MPNIDDLQREVVEGRRDVILAKNDRDGEKAKNDGLLREIEILKQRLKEANAVTAQHQNDATASAASGDAHRRRAEKHQADLASALADLEAERAESGKLRARLIRVRQAAEGKT